jgi:predicted TIM-barrel fold metal-dependent hydrolase
LKALKRDPVFAKQFLVEFQDRVLYARDNFDNKHQEFINSLSLSASVLEKIYSSNAEKLIKE